jgi:hypothetical protein
MFDQGRGFMPLRQNYVSIISRLLPAGALGVSVLLGSAAVGTASEHPTVEPPAAAKDRVSERLAAIRDAVSAVSPTDEGAAKPVDANRQLAWGNWWNNWGGYRPWGGYGWPNWNNWRNWNNWNNFWNNW